MVATLPLSLFLSGFGSQRTRVHDTLACLLSCIHYFLVGEDKDEEEDTDEEEENDDGGRLGRVRCF